MSPARKRWALFLAINPIAKISRFTYNETMKIFFFKILTVLIVLVVFFGIGEICFRIFRDEPNPLAQVTQKAKDSLFEPNSSWHSVSSKKGEFEYSPTINKFGYRGKDFAMPKKKGTLRIFAVGDSFTFGVGAEDNQTIPYDLQEKLLRSHYNIEVINAGVGNTSPITHYLNLKTIHLRYEPDLVVLLFDLTDLWEDWHSERNAVYDRNGEIINFNPMFINGKRDWWITCTYYSAFCRYVHNRIVRSVRKMGTLGFKEYVRAVFQKKRAKAIIANLKAGVSDQVLTEYDGLLMMRGREREALIRRHWQRTEKYLLKIKALLAEKNIPLVIVMYPHGIYVDGGQWSEGRLTWGFEAGKRYTDYLPFKIMKEFTDQEGILFINTLDDFLKAPHQKYFYDWDGHMTPAGYAVVAQSIAGNRQFLSLLTSLKKIQNSKNK